MTIGVLRLDVFIHDCDSLKAKRMILHSLKARLRKSFNVAIAQLDHEDKWQRTSLAIVGVERSRRSMDSILSRIVNAVDAHGGLNIINHEIELL